MTTPLPELAVDRAREQLATARILWCEGQLAHGYQHASAALDQVLAIWAHPTPDHLQVHIAECERAPPVVQALRIAGFRRAADLEDLLTAMATLPLPQDRCDYSPAHHRLFERVWAEADALCTFSGRALASPRLQRRRRAAAIVSIVVALAASTAGFVAIRARPAVSASAEYSGDYAASNAFDGLGATEWLLPNGELGYLEVSFHSPRTVRRVRLRNSHNRFYMDRGAERVRVSLFARDRRLQAAEGEFTALAVDGPEIVVPAAGLGVIAVRVEVLSYFGVGGGLAEVGIE